MHFHIEHTFKNISLEEYESLYFDEGFNEALCREVKLNRQLIEREVKNGHLSRVVKVGPDRELPKPAAKVIGANRIEYTEHLEYDMGTYQGTWETVSSVMTDKVDTRGTFSFQEAAGGGVLRVVAGNIKVKIFGVGGMVEKFIVGDIEKSYESAAAFTQRWIDQSRN